ncbi:hypothetical protein [Leadbettera azotonutricia]|uniref:Putative lipoprotein n=1 Tax=Leadbettera azotonutricia (strain ATCC BAA-888 / DSM 13862 / ZAS-9) TaxID=545695 RepID=F5YAP8_LEAAZ|nr:hypothetical protein [Leadbettera azotonutricia]AEF80685.1 putative lipoprotein [Leadbettera azotonutricia ZAS-9]
MKSGKITVLRLVCLAAALFFCGMLLTGCDLINSRLDDDVAGKIDQAVWEANAPEINVMVEDVLAGVATPGGTLTGRKLDIPFSLKFTPFPAYGFIRWQAFLDGVELGQKEVEFSAPGQFETTVTVHINPGSRTVKIVPLGEGANNVNDFTIFPPPDAKGLVNQNHYVQIRFSKPIDENTIRASQYAYYSGTYKDTWTAYPMYNDPNIDVGRPGPFNPSGNNGQFSVRFNNIRITGTNPGIGIPGYYLENFFCPPVLSADGTVLTLWTRLRNTGTPFFVGSLSGDYWDGNDIFIDIILDGNIKDRSGLSLGTDKRIRYRMKANYTSNSSYPPPAYNSAPHTTVTSANDIFPNLNYQTAMSIFHEDTEGVINPAKFFPRYAAVTPSVPVVVPPSPEDVPGSHYSSKTIYFIFQTTYTQWPVNGIRVFYKNPASPQNYGDDAKVYSYSLYAQGASSPDNTPAEQERRDRILAAYKDRMKGNEYYHGEFPLYVVRLNLKAENAAGTTSYLIVPSIDGEPDYLPGSALAYWAGWGSPMGHYMNRAPRQDNSVSYGEYFYFKYE